MAMVIEIMAMDGESNNELLFRKLINHSMINEFCASGLQV